ncbi:MAG: ABC transporter permease [Bacillota bacterium]
MNLWDIALNNLRRRFRKTLLILLGLALGVATVVALLAITWMMETDLSRQLRGNGTRLVIVPRQEEWNYTYGGMPVGAEVTYEVKHLPLSLLSVLGKQKELEVIAPKFLASLPVEGENNLVVGLKWQEERQIRNYWQIQGQWPRAAGEAAAGAELARARNWQIGQRLKVKDRWVTLTGILAATGQEEDGLLFMNISDLQAVAGQTGALSFVEVLAFRNQETSMAEQEELRSRLASLLPDTEVRLLRQVETARLELLERVKKFGLLITLLVVLVSGMMVIANQLASVKERTREIGILRAIGYRQQHIIRIFLLEAALLCSLGAVAGYWLGILAARLVLPRLVAGLELTAWYPQLALMVLAGAIFLGLAAGYWPARQGAKLDPAEALRYL